MPSAGHLQQGYVDWLISSNITHTGYPDSTQRKPPNNHNKVTKIYRLKAVFEPSFLIRMWYVSSLSSTYITYRWTGYPSSDVHTAGPPSCLRLLGVTSCGPWGRMDWRRRDWQPPTSMPVFSSSERSFILTLDFSRGSRYLLRLFRKWYPNPVMSASQCNTLVGHHVGI